jgi:hypothetical protein
MIKKILALWRNQPSSHEEELMIEALRRESQDQQNNENPNAEERVQDIMRAITSAPEATHSPQTPSTSYSMPVFASLVAVTLVFGGLVSLNERDHPATPISERTKLIETPRVMAYSANDSAEPLRIRSLETLREVALTLPLALEATRLKRDIRRGTDSLLAIAVPWGDLVKSAPTLTIPDIPSLPRTPYQAEFDNLRRDTEQAIDFIEETFTLFNG